MLTEGMVMWLLSSCSGRLASNGFRPGAVTWLLTAAIRPLADVVLNDKEIAALEGAGYPRPPRATSRTFSASSGN